MVDSKVNTDCRISNNDSNYAIRGIPLRVTSWVMVEAVLDLEPVEGVLFNWVSFRGDADFLDGCGLEVVGFWVELLVTVAAAVVVVVAAAAASVRVGLAFLLPREEISTVTSFLGCVVVRCFLVCGVGAV
jgi:hypothetical protein